MIAGSTNGAQFENRRFSRFTARFPHFSKRTNEAGWSVKSKIYEIGGRKWQVKILPPGVLLQSHDCVSCYVRNADKTDVMCWLAISLKGVSNNVVAFADTNRFLNLAAASHEDEENWIGWDDFIRKDILFNPDYDILRNDELQLYIDVEYCVIRYDSLHAATATIDRSALISKINNIISRQKSEPSSDGLDRNADHTHCLFSDVGSDCNILVKATNYSIPAHLEVLQIRSKYFRDKNRLELGETLPQAICILDCKLPVAQAFVCFLYTGVCEDSVLRKYARAMYKIARDFDVQTLVEQCESYFLRNLSIQNCITTLQIGEELNAFILKKNARSLILDMLPELAKTKSVSPTRSGVVLLNGHIATKSTNYREMKSYSSQTPNKNGVMMASSQSAGHEEITSSKVPVSKPIRKRSSVIELQAEPMKDDCVRLVGVGGSSADAFTALHQAAMQILQDETT